MQSSPWPPVSHNSHTALLLQNTKQIIIEHYALSNAPKITYYAFKKMPIVLKIVPLILAL